MFNPTKILDADKIRKPSLAKYCYKKIDSLNNNLRVYHAHNTRNRNRLRPYAHSHTLFERSHIYQAPLIWNDILENCTNITNAPSIFSFKKRYTSYLWHNARYHI